MATAHIRRPPAGFHFGPTGAPGQLDEPEESPALDPLMLRLADKLLASLDEDVRRQLPGSFARPLAQWCGRDLIDLIDHLRHATDDDYMGIGAGRCSLGAGDFIMDLGSRCGTLREALTLCFRFMEMATSALRFRLHEDGNLAVIELIEQPSAKDPHHVLADWNLIVWHKLSQWLTGTEIWLDRTDFVHELDAPYSSYAEMFGSNCLFNSPASRLVFKRSYLEYRVIRTPTEAQWLKTKAPGYFSRPVGLAKPWKRQISEMFRDDIKQGRRLSTIEDLADIFGVSSQTLRRRLRDEGISYRALKAETRREVVLDVLADPRATIGDASIAAGFAETNALNRALRTTRGFTSRELREQVMRWSGK